jgi:hypothetical protein
VIEGATMSYRNYLLPQLICDHLDCVLITFCDQVDHIL